MRKLKLQMQLSVDGFVAGPNGEMDWMEWNWDEGIKTFVNQLTEPVDTIVLGKNLATGFIPHWAAALENPDTNDAFAQKMVNTPKIVFTRSLEQNPWANTRLAQGGLKEAIMAIKQQEGRDMITYGGATLAAALIQEQLIDDLYLFINPTAIGKGMRIFTDRTPLVLKQSVAFTCGIVVHHYSPKH